MDDSSFDAFLRDLLDHACELTPAQTGRAVGLVLSLKGVEPSTVASMWAELSVDDRHVITKGVAEQGDGGD